MNNPPFYNAAEPPDWRDRWDEPLQWPGEAEADPDVSLQAHRAFTPELADSALVLIDIDKKSLDRQIAKWSVHNAEKGEALRRQIYEVALPNQIRLLRFFRDQRLPIVFVQWGWHRYQYPPLERRPEEELVIKRSRGAFASSGLDALLRRKKVETCFFVGADTALCVASTVRGAIDHNYRAVLVEDACISCLERLHDCTIETLGWHQAHILSTDAAVNLAR